MNWTFRDDRPIWMQLAEQLVAHIACGTYVAGGKLPTVRELALQAGVNPNTAQRALAQLEQDGLVLSERGTGRTVTTDTAIIDQVRCKLAQGIADHFFAGMQSIGFNRTAAMQYILQEESSHE